MSIVKSKHASNYVVIPNEIFKQGLSIEAVGLLTYFLSLPHDWVIYKTQLHEQLGIGREKTDRVFKELQNSGYVLTVKGYNKNGQIEYNHIVYDKPYNGEPQTEKPLTVESSTINTQLQSKEEQSKEELINYIPNDFLNLKQKENINSLNTKKETDGFGSVAVDAKFLEYVKTNFPTVAKLQMPNSEQVAKLKATYKFSSIEKTLKAMENKKALLKTYKSCILTLTNWLDRDDDSKIILPLQETETERKIREFKARGF
jgi:hypothetical protein